MVKLRRAAHRAGLHAGRFVLGVTGWEALGVGIAQLLCVFLRLQIVTSKIPILPLLAGT